MHLSILLLCASFFFFQKETIANDTCKNAIFYQDFNVLILKTLPKLPDTLLVKTLEGGKVEVVLLNCFGKAIVRLYKNGVIQTEGFYIESECLCTEYRQAINIITGEPEFFSFPSQKPIRHGLWRYYNAKGIYKYTENYAFGIKQPFGNGKFNDGDTIYYRELDRYYAFKDVIGKDLVDTLSGQIVKVYPINEKGRYMFEIYSLEGVLRVRGHYEGTKNKTKNGPMIFSRIPGSDKFLSRQVLAYHPVPTGLWVYYKPNGEILRYELH